MKSNDKCPNCSASIDQNFKFCGSCGTKILNKNAQIAVDLFSIDSPKNSEPDEDQWDEFLDSQPNPSPKQKVEEDFFHIEENFENEEDDLIDEPEIGIDKKLFTPEDDPNIKKDEAPKKQKKIDKKLQRAIKKKNALKIKSRETKLSFLFFGLSSLLASSSLLVFAIIDFIPKDLLAKIPFSSFKVFSHPIYASVFVIPSLFRFVLNSKAIIKIKSRKQFSQYFAFFTTLFCIFCCSAISLFISNDSKSNILLSLQVNKTIISIDHYYLSVFSYLLFCQMLIHYFFSKKIPFIISSFLSICLMISNIQLYIYLAIPDSKLLFQESTNILGQNLSYYLGPLHSYILPNYLLSQIVLPCLIILLIGLTLKDLLTKDFTNFFYGLYASCLLSIVFLYINHIYLSKTPYSLSVFLKPIYTQLQSFH